MDTLKLQVIISSVRPNRFGDKPAAWIAGLAGEAGFEVSVVDLKDWQLLEFNEKASPNTLNGQLENPRGREWNALLAPADAYVVVTPEYNHGYPASLKNAIDWTYAAASVANKPVAFLSYGTVGGARAVEQLRQVVIELQMAPIRNQVAIVRHWELQDATGALKPGAMDAYADGAKAMLEQLQWWAKALKVAREAK